MESCVFRFPPPSTLGSWSIRRGTACCIAVCRLLALVGELKGTQGARGRDRLFTKRLLARRDRHRIEHVVFPQRVEPVVHRCQC